MLPGLRALPQDAQTTSGSRCPLGGLHGVYKQQSAELPHSNSDPQPYASRLAQKKQVIVILSLGQELNFGFSRHGTVMQLPPKSHSKHKMQSHEPD